MKEKTLAQLGRLAVVGAVFFSLFSSGKAEARYWYWNTNVGQAQWQIRNGNYAGAEQSLENRTCFGSCWNGWAARAETALDNGHPGVANYDLMRAHRFYYWR